MTLAMIPAKIEEALKALDVAIAENSTILDLVAGYWESRGRELRETLSAEVLEAADALDRGLPALTRSSSAAGRLGPLFEDSRGQVVFTWCRSSVSRSDVRLAPC